MEKPGIPQKPKKKVGWINRSKDLKVVVINQKDFQGILLALGQVPLRRIGILPTNIVLPGMQGVQQVVNSSHQQAPPYRFIFTNEKMELYVKGVPPVLIQ